MTDQTNPWMLEMLRAMYPNRRDAVLIGVADDPALRRLFSWHEAELAQHSAEQQSHIQKLYETQTRLKREIDTIKVSAEQHSAASVAAALKMAAEAIADVERADGIAPSFDEGTSAAYEAVLALITPDQWPEYEAPADVAESEREQEGS